MSTDDIPLPAEFRQRLDRLLQAGSRRVLGLAGPPGCGKSTLAVLLRQWLGAQAQVVPMDGFHLANTELQRLGLEQRKGAPETFDSAGYVALLRRLRTQGLTGVVYAPDFRREIEEPVAGSIAVQPQTQLLITEGNYLLLDEGHWADVPSLLDEVWYLEVEQDLRLARLVERHVHFGRSREDAQHWIASNDEPNARLIEASRQRADAVLRWSEVQTPDRTQETA
ncbi:MAG: hypothetical protein RJA36_3682 [Pseudomonadota bacterium]